MKQLAAYYKIPCIDLNSLMVNHYNSIGYDAAYQYHMCSTGSTDMTHFTETGAKAGYPSAGYITAPSEKMEEPVQTTTTTTTTAAVTSETQNLALSGRSSRSFLAEQNYQTLKSSLGKGDYLFIQFGHNDEKTDESVYPGLGTYPNLDWSTLDTSGKDSQGRYSYEYLLTAYYINLAKNKGAVPVLVTPHKEVI